MTDPSKSGAQEHPEMLGETQPFVTAGGGRVREVVVGDASGDASDLTPGTVLGDWRIESKIGQGGMGTVYAAIHAEIGKRAAIKVVRAELVRTPLTAERFVQEARVVNQIGHPNIVDIFHIGRLADGRPYLVMELLRGKTLADRMGDGRLTSIEAIDVLLEIVAAITAAHDQGVVHRDLKPDNIFLADAPGGRSTVKLVDWGIAKLTDALPVSVGLTTTGVMLGTPQYVSPEQARGKHLDARSDIYSLGAIAYEMFLEGPPFVADNVADVVSMHLRETPPPPSDVWPDIPPSLERLLLSMLAKEPDARPSTIEIALTLQMVRGDLDARSSQRSIRRLASGSLPPPLTSSGPLLSPSRAHATPTPSSMPFAPDLSGGVPVIEPDAPRAETTLAVRARARWPWLLASLAVAGAAAAAIGVWAGRGRAPASIAHAAPAVHAAPATAPTPAPTVTPLPDPPAAPVTAPTLDVRVTPTEARILVDGAAADSVHGRVVRPVTAGDHVVRVEAPGFAPVVRTIAVSGTVVVDIVLAPARATGKHKPPVQPASTPTPKPGSLDPNATIEPFQ